MKIVVSINPTTGGAVNADDAHFRQGATPVSALREDDAHAVEQAVRMAQKIQSADANTAVEIVALTLGPAESLGAIRQALALGATRGVICDDAAIRGLDLAAITPVLAELLRSEAADLYLTCTSGTDIDGLLLWLGVGDQLAHPVLTQAASLDLDDQTVRISRQSEHGDQELTATLPCLIDITPSINTVRYPTLRSRNAAQNKPVQLIRVGDLEVDDSATAQRTTITTTEPAAHQRETLTISDPKTAAIQIIDFLKERRFV